MFNTVLLTILAMVVYTAYVFVPIHIRLAWEFFSKLCGYHSTISSWSDLHSLKWHCTFVLLATHWFRWLLGQLSLWPEKHSSLCTLTYILPGVSDRCFSSYFCKCCIEKAMTWSHIPRSLNQNLSLYFFLIRLAFYQFFLENKVIRDPTRIVLKCSLNIYSILKYILQKKILYTLLSKVSYLCLQYRKRCE